MMEDPTAPSSDFDGDVELEEEREMRRLVYLLRVPNELAEPEEMKNTVKFLIQWAKVLSLLCSCSFVVRVCFTWCQSPHFHTLFLSEFEVSGRFALSYPSYSNPIFCCIRRSHWRNFRCLHKRNQARVFWHWVMCVVRNVCASNVDRDYLQLVLFVAELESLRMTTSLGAFQSCNKEGLVRTLWKNRSQEPRVCVWRSSLWCSESR